ncbi:unnamed protein product [Cuscuta campestris]|uniref:Uncharacterized protein n=1 Tax=Cuscuta campestris TaxID=132261 RepID=A0A484M8T1_9ASTE|nr:unnamed protein product [Cuscuta campestris]
MEAHPMMTRLKGLYKARLDMSISKSLRHCFSSKLATGNPVGPHILKMIGQIKTLEKLDALLHPMLATDLILGSLPAEYSQTIVNFYMNKLEMTMPELLKFLTTAEESLGKGKGKSVLMVEGSTVTKKSGPRLPARTKRKGSKQPKPASNSSSLKPKKELRRSLLYAIIVAKGPLEAQLCKITDREERGKETSNLRICMNVRRQLTDGEIQLKVGNGALVNALAVGTYSLSLPSGLVLQLHSPVTVKGRVTYWASYTPMHVVQLAR